MIDRMKLGLEASNKIRKENRDTINAQHEKSIAPEDAKHKVDKVVRFPFSHSYSSNYSSY